MIKSNVQISSSSFTLNIKHPDSIDNWNIVFILGILLTHKKLESMHYACPNEIFSLNKLIFKNRRASKKTSELTWIEEEESYATEFYNAVH